MADSSNLVRGLVVRAEDARLLGDFVNFKKAYKDLRDLNRDLASSYSMRAANQQALSESLKALNQIIQRAAGCWAGRFKTQAVNDCRAAILGQPSLASQAHSSKLGGSMLTATIYTGPRTVSSEKYQNRQPEKVSSSAATNPAAGQIKIKTKLRFGFCKTRGADVSGCLPLESTELYNCSWGMAPIH
uniref:BBS2_C domain-containing protein n=1 Tax=Macrostomum lignano TaxID=282301 RepID=A0A1I8FL33_9PLAT